MRRVTATSALPSPSRPSELSKTRVTSAVLMGRRFSVPAKMMSSAFCPRRLRMFDSPNTQRIASVILLLPLPFGPTMAVMPGENCTIVLSAKDLNPFISNRRSCMNTTFNLLRTFFRTLYYTILSHIFSVKLPALPSQFSY